MKSFFALSFVFLTAGGYAQTVIPSYLLFVSYQMTSNIIFPYRIEKADIGSADVIGHKDEKLGNVLFLKANRKGFQPTNLSVYTSDGKFYSFIVQYKVEPDTLNLEFGKPELGSEFKSESPLESKSAHGSGQPNVAAKRTEFPVSEPLPNKAQLDSDAIEIGNENSFLHKSFRSEEMKLSLKGIYLKDRLVWFKIALDNESSIDYPPEFIRFFIRDKRTTKRTASQETEKTPIWHSAVSVVNGGDLRTLLFAFPAFTLDPQKKLMIQIGELNGGRLLSLPVKPKVLLKSRVINR